MHARSLLAVDNGTVRQDDVAMKSSAKTVLTVDAFDGERNAHPAADAQARPALRSAVASENSVHLARGQQRIRAWSIAFLFVCVLCDCFKSRRRLEAEILVRLRLKVSSN